MNEIRSPYFERMEAEGRLVGLIDGIGLEVVAIVGLFFIVRFLAWMVKHW